MQTIQYSDKTNRFHKPGTLRLTYYEFRCGYVQQLETAPCSAKPGTGTQLQIWMEHGTFHVRAHDFQKHERIFWDSFDTMTEANRRFFRAKWELGL